MACTTASSLERLCHGIMAFRSMSSAIPNMLAVSWRSGVLQVFIGQIFLQALWYCLCTGQHCMPWQDCKNSFFELGWHWAMNVLMEQQSVWTISEHYNATLLDEGTSMQHWCESDHCSVQAVPVALLGTGKVHRQISKVGRLHLVHNMFITLRLWGDTWVIDELHVMRMHALSCLTWLVNPVYTSMAWCLGLIKDQDSVFIIIWLSLWILSVWELLPHVRLRLAYAAVVCWCMQISKFN